MACDDDSKTLRFIEEMSRNARAMQQNLLAQILAENAETEYLKAFGLEGATDRETFKSKIPMVTYEDIQPLIRRIADGDRSPILSVHPVSEFIISTGTSTGEGKLIPTIKKESDQRLLLCSLMPPIINQHLVKGVSMNGKMLLFMFTKPESKTKGGIVVRSSLTSFYKSDHFKNRYNDASDVFITPNEAIYCDDSFQSMYTQLLYGLYEREHVLVVGTMFASGLLQAIRFLQLNWQQLTHDIRTGTLNSKVNDVPIRECITRILRPEPDLAESISRDCAKGDWEGIIARIWPKAKFLQAVITGTMAQYVSTLDYYSGGLPIVSMVYASSECYFGINLNPMCKPSEVSYTIMPFLAYFEFLPHDPNSPEHASPELVDLVDVEIGKEYELVITTFAGFYRYRMGDILRVIGFHNSLPQFQFVRRKNVILSIDSDKTKEPELQEAVENASRLLHESNTSVVEYTSYAETKAIPGHYVIYWELMQMGSKGSPSDKVLDQCCLAMEESFDQQYRRCRVVDKSIGPLEIRVVENGTFEELMNYAISKGASMSQYKVPKCISAKPMVDLLESRVMSKHFSPSLPHWTSEQSL